MRPSVTRTFITKAAPERVHDYLADFTNAEEWDPGTKSCTLSNGDGGVGSTYRNVSVFLGRETEIEYTVAELERPTRIHLVGRNEQFEGHDVLGVRAHAEGAEVTYHAEFAFRGAARLAAPLVAAYLPRLAEKTIRQLRASLDHLVED
ncbi:polyketide cyclase [Nocardioides sp. JQ2195]|uniref:SRPBCC family protein n=1 Tax=Nocardioides sp. JQ2195 TaxID=2592334 RepID=UPI00143EA573|nr:SRPBCC family protein [Nocardioides sp. JQ2195]QIX26665.1 polyketide cyclase [Nocardioides sp. JQ2195]